MKKLDYPDILKVYDLIEDGSSQTIIMEYFEGIFGWNVERRSKKIAICMGRLQYWIAVVKSKLMNCISVVRLIWSFTFSDHV